jgi:DNA-directed RNA polymerase alpha subunit
MHVDPGFESVTTAPVPPAAPAGETSLQAAEFSNRAMKRLIGIGARSLEHLADFTIAELKAIKGFGAGCLTEVREKLAARGLRLKDDT